jgi:hypothetical protein
VAFPYKRQNQVKKKKKKRKKEKEKKRKERKRKESKKKKKAKKKRKKKKAEIVLEIKLYYNFKVVPPTRLHSSGDSSRQRSSCYKTSDNSSCQRS